MPKKYLLVKQVVCAFMYSQIYRYWHFQPVFVFHLRHHPRKAFILMDHEGLYHPYNPYLPLQAYIVTIIMTDMELLKTM